MKLVQLIYKSRSIYSISDKMISDILSKSVNNNEKYDLTGLLLTADDYFVQCLEGDYMSINRIYYKIINDRRHENVTLLSYHSIAERLFPEWKMGFIETNDTMKNTIINCLSGNPQTDIDSITNEILKTLIDAAENDLIQNNMY